MIAIGSRYYPSDENGSGRQQRAREAILRLKGVLPVNLQFTDESLAPEGFTTLPVLTRDSRTVTGAAGPRMPVVSEMLDRLAEVAGGRACRYFMFVNADIQVTQEAIECIASTGLDGYAFSRGDVDPGTGAFAGMMILGIDALAFDVRWWTRERRRFRPYLSGPYWDNVYAAILCSHGRGRIVSERPLIYHERHPATWSAEGACTRYNGFLAALDGPYFSRWVTYVGRIRGQETTGNIDPDAVSADVFAGPLLSPAGHALHAARCVLARARYARARMGKQP
jgi:hypothetical protein